MDTWIENYNAPSIDKTQQNYENLSGRIENGETILEFSRKRSTNDEYDLPFTDEQCLHFMYIVKGGSFHGINKKIRKHEQLPIVSAQKICIINNGEEEEVTTPLPPRLFYDVEVKLVGIGKNYRAPSPGSQDFEDISNKITESFTPALKKVLGFHQLRLDQLQK